MIKQCGVTKLVWWFDHSGVFAANLLFVERIRKLCLYRLSVAYPIKQHIRRSTVFSYTSIFTEFSVVIGELYSLSSNHLSANVQLMNTSNTNYAGQWLHTSWFHHAANKHVLRKSSGNYYAENLWYLFGAVGRSPKNNWRRLDHRQRRVTSHD